MYCLGIMKALWAQSTMYGALGLSLESNRLSARSEEHTSELQSLVNLVCRLLLEKKKKTKKEKKKKEKQKQKKQKQKMQTWFLML